ncbi:MAG: lysophospholipid acyltransferase family protein [Deltaproteobacteria bacterium]|nr:MAG: lysophospholipid acyltransferase family protein [Deltaproteobacteria bacterium]
MPPLKDEKLLSRSKEPEDSRGALEAFIAGISVQKIQRLGKLFGTLVFHLDFAHRRIVRRNLKFIHSDWPRGRIREFSKRIFQNLGITFAEICQMMFLSKNDILSRVTISGIENLSDALKAGKGAIMISAHLGNWEMAALVAPFYLDTPVAAVARKLRFEPINKFIVRLRSRFGFKVIDKEGALPEMRQVLRRGEILGILIDQGTRRSEGIDVTFFGRKVRATPSAALLALRCRSPVIPVFCVREPGGGLSAIIESPLKLERTGDLRTDLTINTQNMTDAIEKAVWNYPDQWFWVHKRWKHHYPDMFPEYQKRRKRRRARKNRKRGREIS